MRHLIATLLTLFPGLDLGHALLDRWLDFSLAFIASAVAWTLLYLGFFVVDRPLGFIFQPLPALPVMLLNLSLTHRIWTQTPAPSTEEGLADEHWYTFHAASFLAKGFFP
jgi:hypothetical protein